MSMKLGIDVNRHKVRIPQIFAWNLVLIRGSFYSVPSILCSVSSLGDHCESHISNSLSFAQTLQDESYLSGEVEMNFNHVSNDLQFLPSWEADAYFLRHLNCLVFFNCVFFLPVWVHEPTSRLRQLHSSYSETSESKYFRLCCC